MSNEGGAITNPIVGAGVPDGPSPALESLLLDMEYLRGVEDAAPYMQGL